MAGDETARLAHALDAHVYNFFEVHCQSPLLYAVISFLLFINTYILLKLTQKPPQKSKIFLGGHALRPP